MNKLEFIHWLQNYKNSLGLWHVDSLKESFGQYTVGCFKDYSTNEYIVYLNDERKHRIRLTTKSQDEAYCKLKSMVEFIIENNKGYI